jgi:hypothetical protein
MSAAEDRFSPSESQRYSLHDTRARRGLSQRFREASSRLGSRLICGAAVSAARRRRDARATIGRKFGHYRPRGVPANGTPIG